MKHVNGIWHGATVVAVIIAAVCLAPTASAHPHVTVVIAVPGITVGAGHYYRQSGYWGARRVYVTPRRWVYYGVPVHRTWYRSHYRYRYYRPGYGHYHRHHRYHHRNDHRGYYRERGYHRDGYRYGHWRH